MKSGDKFINIALKRFLSHNRLKENFLEYLQDGQWEHVSRIFPTQGLFTYPATLTHPGTSGATYVDFSPDPIIGSDGEGHILEADGAQLIDVPFPKTNSKDYWFAMHYAEIPSGLYLNPRTGIPEYDTWEEAIGRTAAPSAVTPGVGTITFNVNSVCASGVDYSGMTVTVWLNNPQDSDEAVAIETATVAYGAPNNTITTVAELGQSSVSTTLSDYTICLNGIVWEEVAPAAGNPFASDYTILGYAEVDGVGAVTTYDSAVQNDISGGGGHSLQNAYTYTGSGAGKDILANYEAVEITQENTAFHEDDIVQAALRLTKDGNGTAFADTAKDYEVGMDIPSRAQMYAGVLQRARLIDETKNGELQKDETITFSAAGNTIAFTRGGTLDLLLPTSTPNADILVNHDLVEISGSTSDDGVYLISAVVSAQLTVTNLDGTAISFTAAHGGSALANIYRPIARLGAGGDAGTGRMSGGLRITTLGDFHYASTAAPQDIGAVDIVVPPGADDGDYIIHADRNSTDTFLLKADANVSTTGNYIIDHASNNYTYLAARTFYRSYSASHITYDLNLSVLNYSTPATDDYILITGEPNGTSFASIELLDIPHGATITAIDVLVRDSGNVGDEINYYLISHTTNWGTSTPVKAILSGAYSSTAAGTDEVVSSGAISIGPIDKSDEAYTLEFNTVATTVTAINGRIYAVRVTYTCTNVIP